MGLYMHFAGVWLKESIIADEEDERCARSCNAAIARDSLLALRYFQESYWYVPRFFLQKSVCLVIVPITHDDDFQIVCDRLPLNVMKAACQNLTAPVCRDDDGKRWHGIPRKR